MKRINLKVILSITFLNYLFLYHPFTNAQVINTNHNSSQNSLLRHKSGTRVAEDAIKRSFTLYESGKIKDKRGQFQEAINDYTNALAAPGISDLIKIMALTERAISKEKLGRFQEAIEDFTAILMIPNIDKFNFFTKSEALCNRGRIKLILLRFQEAIQDFEEALKCYEILDPLAPLHPQDPRYKAIHGIKIAKLALGQH